MAARVGLCEDDADVRSVLVRALRAEGFQVRAALTGHEAVEVFSAAPPDLLVLDVGDGFAASDAEAAFAPGVSSSGGAGLGLPLARRLARSVGGEVSATASTGGGHVVLRLPAIG